VIMRIFSRRSRPTAHPDDTRLHPVASDASREALPEVPAAGNPRGPSGRFTSELFARLLLELPDHRHALLTAFEENNPEQLRAGTHKLLGAVVYCDLPQLASALRELRQAYDTGDRERLQTAFNRTIHTLDQLLAASGYTAG